MKGNIYLFILKRERKKEGEEMGGIGALKCNTFGAAQLRELQPQMSRHVGGRSHRGHLMRRL